MYNTNIMNNDLKSDYYDHDDDNIIRSSRSDYLLKKFNVINNDIIRNRLKEKNLIFTCRRNVKSFSNILNKRRRNSFLFMNYSDIEFILLCFSFKREISMQLFFTSF